MFVLVALGFYHLELFVESLDNFVENAYALIEFLGTFIASRHGLQKAFEDLVLLLLLALEHLDARVEVFEALVLHLLVVGTTCLVGLQATFDVFDFLD